MIVTIDGPAGSGKSTAARGLAERLGFQFLDTGAMYRVVAWQCLQKGLDPDDEPAVAQVAAAMDMAFADDRILVDGIDLTDQIRTPEVTQAASVVAGNPDVRRAMIRLQREAARTLNIVTEGRDQGTVVFPDADYKFFLTAEVQVRARRRQHEMASHGSPVSLEETLRQITDRDERDVRRSIAPLVAAEDAVHIDTSHMTIEEVINRLEQIVREQRDEI